jgi:hypothetical protein
MILSGIVISSLLAVASAKSGSGKATLQQLDVQYGMLAIVTQGMEVPVGSKFTSYQYFHILLRILSHSISIPKLSFAPPQSVVWLYSCFLEIPGFVFPITHKIRPQSQ